MSFYNGIPIATINIASSVAMPTDSPSRRRADENARPNPIKAAALRLRQK
ncbi:MAG TPA: hypothetical protein VFE36_08760 [Candidatus Baltobacteraceae bacterium]|nr:hypothetical protein [Candidatus Baltobacteraceae bacterium]